MTKAVFENTDYTTYEYNNEWLSLYMPTHEDICMFLQPEYRRNLKQINASEYIFSGKKFKFLVSKDGRLFARTKERLWTIYDFVDEYKDYVFLDSKSSMPDSYSYSQMQIEDVEYHY